MQSGVWQHIAVARSGNDVKLFVDGIAYMTNVSYDGIKNIPSNIIIGSLTDNHIGI